MSRDYQGLLYEFFQAGVTACTPAVCLPPFFDSLNVSDRLCVLGAGKAAVQMAAVVEAHYPGQCFGTVVTRYGHASGENTGAIQVIEAGHPVPDENSLRAAEYILAQAQELPAEIPAVVLLSGGGSSLMSLPAQGVSFSDKQEIQRFLQKAGASINEINTVRKQLSAIKGGKLANALKHKDFSTFVISDVVGDDPAVIASGPTVSDRSTPREAMAILKRYDWQAVPSVEALLLQKKTDDRNIRDQQTSRLEIIASTHVMLEAASQAAHTCGWPVEYVADDVVGEAAEIGRQHAAMALAAKAEGRRCILLSGGELVVTHDGKGKGGPNQEYLLSLAATLRGEPGIYAMACDSDGIDGSEDNAGAFIAPESWKRARALGLDVGAYLKAHDSYSFFKKLGDLIVTGPTGTNVNDFRAILVDP